jgi:hypothetical protein
MVSVFAMRFFGYWPSIRKSFGSLLSILLFRSLKYVFLFETYFLNFNLILLEISTLNDILPFSSRVRLLCPHHSPCYGLLLRATLTFRNANHTNGKSG